MVEVEVVEGVADDSADTDRLRVRWNDDAGDLKMKQHK